LPPLSGDLAGAAASDLRPREHRVPVGAAALQRHADRARAAVSSGSALRPRDRAGYVGSIAGVRLVAPFVTGARGIPAGGRQASFLPTAALFLLFSLPLFLFCRDHFPRPGRGGPPGGL